MSREETTAAQVSQFDWRQLNERVRQLEGNRRMVAIDLHTVLGEDPLVYEIQPGDREALASVSVSDVKELLLAINVCSRRIFLLAKDLERAEARIESLERGLQAIANYHE